MTTQSVLGAVAVMAVVIVVGSVSRNFSILIAILLGGLVLAGYAVIQKQKSVDRQSVK